MADGGEGGGAQTFNLEDFLNRLVARNQNDPREALRVLSQENYNHRRAIKNLKRERDALLNRPELKTGETVISADDAKLLESYKALGLAPDKVKEVLAERDELKQKDVERENAKIISKGLKHLKMEPELMSELVRDKKLQHKLGEREVENEDGEKETVSVLLIRGGDAEEWQPADKYAEKNLKGYLPALRLKEDGSESQDEDTGEESGSDQEREPRPRQVPRQSSARGKAPNTVKDVVGKVINQKYTPPSKLQQQGA